MEESESESAYCDLRGSQRQSQSRGSLPWRRSSGSAWSRGCWLEYEIKWARFHASDNTWEPVGNLGRNQPANDLRVLDS